MAIDGVPKVFALGMRDERKIKTFIETGTYKGDTTRWAAGEFEQVITIEAYRPRMIKTKAALSDKLPNVKFCYGNSGERLAKERDLLGDDPVMMWLDAHWCGNYELSQDNRMECPLMDELKAVRANDIVMIDDARLFLSPPPRPHDPEQWPTFEQIKKAKPSHAWRVAGDVLVGLPEGQVTVKNDTPRAAVVTSNKYVHFVTPFAHLWLKHCATRYPVTVVRYDVKTAKQSPVVFSQFAIGNQADFSFSSGLARYMAHYAYSHIMLFLEDYWLTRADCNAIDTLWRYALDHPEVAKIDLTGDRMKFAHAVYTTIGDIQIVESTNTAPYRASLQAAIWRRDYLTDVLDRGDWSPWEFERLAGQNDNAVILGVVKPVVEYVNACGGEGNKPGKYDMRKIPREMWQELLEKGLVS